MKYFKLSVELGNPDSLIELAEISVRSGDFLRAVDLLKRLLAEDKGAVIPSVRQEAVRKLKKISRGNGLV